MGVLTYQGDRFYMDGQPFQIISGAIHYFRVPPQYWEDRLKKLIACGFNTVETYVCWNRHERQPGQFDFSGQLDLEGFISLAERLGLYVIVRPGPYICAEWEFGGLPSWLLKDADVPLRCNDDRYLEKVKPYYQQLFDRLRPHLSTNGGKVIMLQVENEYGSYGDDQEYLQKVAEIYRENRMDCMLFTADGSKLWMLSGGTIPGILVAGNLSKRVHEQVAAVRKFRPGQPFFCGEFWSGWFDHWHEEHDPGRGQQVLDSLQDFFDENASFNFYMFHGGTNFGFWNGANHSDTHYLPTVTSYDYCAPLNEAGDMTPAYYAVRDIIAKNTGKQPPQLDVANTPKAAYGEITLTQQASLFSNLQNLSQPISAAYPQTMEQLGQDVGYLLYSTKIRGPMEPLELVLTQLHDRAHVFLNGKLAGIWERSRRQDPITIGLATGEEATLEILVENMGRVNYGPHLFDRKGILGGVRLGNRFHFGWDHYCLPMEDISTLQWQQTGKLPAFFRGQLEIAGTPCDTFIRLDGFEKGFVMVNGHNLGRYYNSAGPQKTLYLPAPFLREGSNEIIVFETDRCIQPVVTFVDTPDLG